MAKKKPIKSGSIEEELAEMKTERDKILNFNIKFKCKTKKQKEALTNILTKEISFLCGIVGSGKSYVSCYAALQLLKDSGNKYKKILFIYPVEVSKEESIGYLKGSEQDKIQPYTEADIYTMEKIINECGKDGKEIIRQLINSGQIEFKSSTFLRGATIDNSIVLISECQNFSKHALLKILTRIGTDSKYIFSGDLMQLDAQSIKNGKNEMGIKYAMDVLKDLPEFGFTEMGLEDVVRNDIIVKILKRWLPETYGNLNEEEEFEKARIERLNEEENSN